MAVKTEFADDVFTAILTQYNLGAFRSAVPLTTGTVQSNWVLHTEQSRYIFKYYESRPLESVRFEANVLTYIHKRQFPCAAPLRNRQGEMVGVYDAKPYIIFEFIEGQHPEDLDNDAQQQVIHAAAQLQTITKTYRPAWRQFRWNYNPSLCLRLAQTKARELNTPTAWAKLAWFEQQLNALQLPAALPKGICHCDYDRSNLLFRQDKLVALIDFDDANYTYLLFDLVNLIDGWAWPYQGALDLEFARRIVGEYSQIRPLSNLEKQHIFDVHQLQILFDGIWFYARGDADDFYEREKINYLNSLGRDAYLRAVV